jgi:hypothetical protein
VSSRDGLPGSSGCEGTPDSPADLDQSTLANSLQSQVHDQARFFDSLEALLAGWARLSLLLFPSSRKGSGSEFRIARGIRLRAALGISESSVFADRELRDAWMHFDERLDTAVSGGTFGNRHSFVRSERVRDYINNTLRLMEVDTLVVHYRSRHSEARSADLRALRRELLEIGAAAGRARAG